jgi:competence protein ComGC
MIVIVIISILIGAAVAQYVGLTPEARRIRARQDMESISSQLNNYALRHNGRYPSNLRQLESEHAVSIPESPWDHKYWIDRYFIYCFVPLEGGGGGNPPDRRLSVEEIAKPPSYKNTVRLLYRNPGSMVLQSDSGIIVRQPIISADPGRNDGKAAILNSGGTPRWFHRGQSIVCSSATSGYGQLTIRTIAGTEESLGVTGKSPSPSPDRKSLAFEGRLTTSSVIMIYSLSERSASPLGTDSNPVQGNEPAWSPHGDLIAFVTSKGDIAITNSRAKHAILDVRVLNTAKTCSNPVWHPSGQIIGFIANGNIYKASLAGTGGSELVFDVSGMTVTSFSWSPDGNLLAIVSGNKLYTWSVDWAKDLSSTPSSDFMTSINIPVKGSVKYVSW